MAVKKVAIATWWHYHNYGSALQVTATHNILKKMGYKPDVINYIPSGKKYSTNVNADQEHEENWKKYARVADKNREKKFNTYLKNHLTFTPQAQDDKSFAKLNEKYDAFITGSDQIWAPRVFDERYFLDFVQDNRKKIAYAPSIGLPTIENEYVKDRMRGLISQFAHVSVREEQGARTINNELSLDKVEVMPDPTLLLSYDDWRKIIPKRKVIKTEKYILCYFLGENDRAWQHAEKIANQTGHKIKIIPVLQKDEKYGDFVDGVGPEEFFNLIDDAEIVLTDSLHATIFSIITQTPFYVFERFKEKSGGSQNSRIYNLLKMVNLENRLIKREDKLREKYDLNSSFNAQHQVIASERERATEYLKKALTIDAPLVSILVAVYNVEKFIKQCLDSILSQTYKNLEVVVVDDGTPDSSGKIADEYARKDQRVRVIHKNNGGLSTTRNVGLDNARGEYIMFVDGDDAIAPDCVEYFVGLIENTGTQIATSKKRWEEWDDGAQIDDRFEIWTPAQAIQGVFEWTLPEEAWNKIYRKDLIEKHHLRFKTEFLSSEGQTFNHFAIEKTNGVGVGYRRVWFYRSNPNSATRATDIKRWETCFDAHEYKKTNLKIWNKDIEKAWRMHVWWSYCSVARVIYQADEEKKYRKNLRRYIWNIRKHILWAIQWAPSKELKKHYIEIFLNPKKALEQDTTRIIANRMKNNSVDPEKMPWEVEIPPRASTVENMTPQEAEIERLRSEIDSFLSVKRSARLLAGNVKRHYSRTFLSKFKRAFRLRTRAKSLLISIKCLPSKTYWLPKNIILNFKVNRIVKRKLDNGNKIPKVIHYIWVGGAKKPESVEKYIKSWMKFCPDYEIIEWSEQNYNIKKNRYTREAYGAKKWAFVTDYMRLDILDRFGGIYMDSDVEVLKSLDGFLKDPAFSSFEAGDPSQIFLPTGIMGSERAGRWVKYLKSYYSSNRSFFRTDGSIDDTPNTLTISRMTVDKYGIELNNKLQRFDDFTMYPSEYFCPKSWSTRKINPTKNTHTIHHFAASWLPPEIRELQHKGERKE